MTYVWEYECDSNWKIPAENTSEVLESYHVTSKYTADSIRSLLWCTPTLPSETQAEHHVPTDKPDTHR
jgi:hypothetical protein